MSPVDKRLIATKSAAMTEYLDRLARKIRAPASTYLKDRDLQLQVERLCQLAVECAIDLAAAAVAGSGAAPPPGAHDTFLRLAQLRPAALSVCKRFALRYTGFRNRLVHEYERLDQTIIHATARSLIRDGRRFLRALAPFR